MALERLQKIMAAAGVASRRKSEELITAGHVSVNGQTVTELGVKADPETDHIRVDGKPLHAERKLYLLLHKPKGYVSTVTDPEGRPTVMDLVRDAGARLYPVGRLDYLSEGLLLLTNDGDLAQRLTRAASHVPKTYLVKVSGRPSEESITKLRQGVMLPPENRHDRRRPERTVKTAPARITLIREADNPWYEVTLTEGRNRQIRRMFKQVGHNVEKIRRVRYGPLELDVPPGHYRRLTREEVASLTRTPQPKASPERVARGVKRGKNCSSHPA
jgi:23S rRNA pseudouridine2605 synthase